MRPGRLLVVALMLAGASACRIVRPLDADPDVVALGVLLVAGEDEARLLAVHPHREPGEDAPDITAELAGPGWSVFFDDPQLEGCATAEELAGPARCLRAALPDTVRADARYVLRGTAPLGQFGGRIVVPPPPRLIWPPDTLRAPFPDDSGAVGLAVRHHVHVDVGTLLVEVLDVFETLEDGTEAEIPAALLGSFPKTIELRAENVIGILHRSKPLRFSLRLHGVGWGYTRFARHMGRKDPLVRPWPNFGVAGEGVFGYFDGVAVSRAAHIFLK
ncbi:MAG: hypothetical protein OXU64_11510 [Gemmatimonadota bacterium]|nr:hypothetical protein [Gemmatimonadota bacterium]